MALVALGGDAWLNQRDAAMRRLAVTGTLFAAAGLAVFGLATWNTAFNAPYRARLAALDAIPAGPFLAIDAAAGRDLADLPVFGAPPGGPPNAAFVAAPNGSRQLG